MLRELKVVELGRNICPYLEGEHRHYLDFFTTNTLIQSHEEPERSDEFEQQLLDFILTLAACRLEKREPIESLISWYFIEEMARKRRNNKFKLLETIPEHGVPLWKLKLRAFIITRDYKNTWKDRLKSCIVLVTVLHILACFFIPEIREWTLDIIVRFNQDYFTRLAERLEPSSHFEADLIQFLMIS